MSKETLGTNMITYKCKRCGETFKQPQPPFVGHDTINPDEIREVGCCWECLIIGADKMMESVRVETINRPDDEPRYYGLQERTLFPFGIPGEWT